MIQGKWTGLEEALAAAEQLGRELGSEKVIVPVLKAQAEPLLEDIRARLETLDNPATEERFSEGWVATTGVDAAGMPVVRVGPIVQKKGAARVGHGWKVWFFERGTSKMAARPVIRPAWDAFAPGFPKVFAAALRERAAAVMAAALRRAMRRRRAA